MGRRRAAAPLSESDRAAIEAEIADLDNFARLATSIDHNARKSIVEGARHRDEESRGYSAPNRRQSSLPNHVALKAIFFACASDSAWKDASSYSTDSNTDDGSKAIYAAWLERHQGPTV